MGIKVKTILCFTIVPEMKRKGIATWLLERVCKDAAQDGFDFVVAYPNIESIDEAGWHKKAADLERLKLMIKNSDLIITAWDNDSMIGFARCITDRVFNGQINTVIVDSKYRKRGIGSRLVTMSIESNPKVTYMLRTEAENENFYKKIGFKTSEFSLIYERKE